MLNIEDKGHQPSVEEMIEYVGNPLFREICDYMEKTYQAIQSVEYSGDKILLGWNLKFKKAGRTLCTVYPRVGHFPLLLIVGKKEKERVEEILSQLSEEFQKTYHETKEGMGQRWMLFDFNSHTAAYDDVLTIVQIRRTGK